MRGAWMTGEVPLPLAPPPVARKRPPSKKHGYQRGTGGDDVGGVGPGDLTGLGLHAAYVRHNSALPLPMSNGEHQHYYDQRRIDGDGFPQICHNSSLSPS